jgi:hypothetical protein
VKLLFSASVTVIAPRVGPVDALLTLIPKVPFELGANALVALTAIARSGAAVTATVSVEELFAALASPAVATVAVLVRFPAAAVPATETVSAMLPADAALAIGPGFVQVTTWAAAAQVQFVPEAETNPKLALSVSVTVIGPVVGALPTLLTATTNTPLVPAVKLPE